MNAAFPFLQMLQELEGQRLTVILVPAPEPKHPGHCIRVAVEWNPSWYSDLVWQRTYVPKGKRLERPTVGRREVVNALRKLIAGKNPGGWVAEYLKGLAE